MTVAHGRRWNVWKQSWAEETGWFLYDTHWVWKVHEALTWMIWRKSRPKLAIEIGAWKTSRDERDTEGMNDASRERREWENPRWIKTGHVKKKSAKQGKKLSRCAKATVRKHHKLGDLKKEIHFLVILEARNLHIWFLLRGPRESLPGVFISACGDGWQPSFFLDNRCFTQGCASVFTWSPLWTSSYKDMNQIEFRSPPHSTLTSS